MIYTRCIPKIDETKYERSTDGNRYNGTENKGCES